jgi:hypothetical protein
MQRSRRGDATLPRACLRAALLLVASAACVALGCSDNRLPVGAACTSASMCASRLCLQRSTGGACAQTCTTSAQCTGGDVCGRFDYREPDPESGLLTGPSTEVLQVCRPSFRVACSAAAPRCPGAGDRCVQGSCVQPCGVDADCASELCARDSCGGGVCAPLCDDPRECPDGWYCNLTTADALGHGRCEPISDGDAGPIDAGVCNAPDAATLDVATGDARADALPDAGAADADF